jgi:NADH dehydrogenase FAD-containing subunit
MTGLLCDYYKKEDVLINLEELCHSLDYEFVNKKAIKLYPELKKIILDDNEVILYDILVINVGAKTYIPHENENILNNCILSRPLIEFYDKIEQKEKDLIRINNNFPEKIIQVAVVGGGFCGYELAFCLNYRWKKILNQQLNITIYIKQKQSEITVTIAKLSQIARSKGISCVYDRNIVDIHENTLFTNKNIMISPVDCVIWSASPRPSSFIQDSNLDLDENGWIIANTYLNALNYKNIFCCGDCITLEGFNLEKAGVYAVDESMIISDNIKSIINKRNLTKYYPKQNVLQLLTLGDNQAFGKKYNFTFYGKTMFMLKRLLDYNYMYRFKQNPYKDWKHRLEKTMKLIGIGLILYILYKFIFR